MNFHLPSQAVSKLPTKKQGGAQNFKGLSQDGGQANFAENLCASPFNKDLSNETSFCLIHQYL
jgi:hypothetical protein